jgi:hypothetical protein
MRRRIIVDQKRGARKALWRNVVRLHEASGWNSDPNGRR